MAFLDFRIYRLILCKIKEIFVKNKDIFYESINSKGKLFQSHC